MNQSKRTYEWVLICAVIFAGCGENGGDGAVPDAGGGSRDAAALGEEAGPPADASDSAQTPEASEDAPGDAAADDAGSTQQCPAAEVPCIDQHVAALMLREVASGGEIAEVDANEGEFLSRIDATAGGIGGKRGYTYARFTSEGLVRVELSDEQALGSTAWDIAVRRYIIRLNSGVSGPSCVLGARTAADTAFEQITSVPEGLDFQAEQYFASESCEFVPDSSGIGAPQTVLSSFWSYPGCVAMTNNVYVLRLATGSHIKLQVASYYEPSVQEACNETGEVSDSSSAGTVRLRWARLD